MSQSINTNIAALNAQRNLTHSQKGLSLSLQRLSTGLRINSARDDAAGLAISERFSSQIRGLDQASRNANDAISLAQVAEGALEVTTANLQRVRELAVQSANATNTAADRAALQKEVAQLVAEIERTATSTQFNGVNLLDGSFAAQQFQVGANAGQTISVSIGDARIDQLGSIVNSTSSATNSSTVVTGSTGTGSYFANATTYTGVNGTASDGTNISINGTQINASAAYAGQNALTQDDASAFALAAAINASGVTGVTATASASHSLENIGGGAGLRFVGAGTTQNYSLSINTVEVYTQGFAGTGVTSHSTATIANAINEHTGETGVTASVDKNLDLILTSSDGSNIVVSESMNQGGGSGVITSLFGFGNWAGPGTGTGTYTYRAAITLESSDGISIDSGFDILGYSSGELSDTNPNVNLRTLDISTAAAASMAIMQVDAALTEINSSRATLGAVQSRFESTMSNLAISTENLSAARSRIMDTDFAVETANLTRAQILQQAGTSIMAQANSLPRNVLSLLQ